MSTEESKELRLLDKKKRNGTAAFTIILSAEHTFIMYLVSQTLRGILRRREKSAAR